ncbi:hypothetical protein B0H12DRAFT_1148651 [Mycena haematopus]|nr:hypothetical protein B0H12DRAFT_1148651 [Mycena haematopus]
MAARVFFMLFALVGTFQTLAAPLQSRASQCGSFNVQAGDGISSARNALGVVNTATDPNARNLLAAQLSLLDAEAGSSAVAKNLSDNASASGSFSTLIAGLQAAQTSLSQIPTEFINNVTLTAVTTANSSIATALDSAQQAVTAKC